MHTLVCHVRVKNLDNNQLYEKQQSWED